MKDNIYTTLTISMTKEEYLVLQKAWKEWYIKQEDKSPRELSFGTWCKDIILNSML